MLHGLLPDGVAAGCHLRGDTKLSLCVEEKSNAIKAVELKVPVTNANGYLEITVK